MDVLESSVRLHASEVWGHCINYHINTLDSCLFMYEIHVVRSARRIVSTEWPWMKWPNISERNFKVFFHERMCLGHNNISTDGNYVSMSALVLVNANLPINVKHFPETMITHLHLSPPVGDKMMWQISKRILSHVDLICLSISYKFTVLWPQSMDISRKCNTDPLLLPVSCVNDLIWLEVNLTSIRD